MRRRIGRSGFRRGFCSSFRRGFRCGEGRRVFVGSGGFERAGRMAFLGLQARRFAQPFPDADNVVVARAKPLVGVFVCIAGLVERGADPFERRGEGYQLFVEFQSAGGDLLGVLVLIVVFPEVGHQLEQGEQVRRRGDDDFPVVGVRPDRRIVLQGGEECRFVGYEHDDEVGRVEPPLVLLAAQLGDVLAHRGHVRREVRSSSLSAEV